MTDQEPTARSMDVADEDWAEQQRPVNPAEDADVDEEQVEPDPDPSAALRDAEANEADVLEQHTDVPEGDEYPEGTSAGPASF